MSKTLFKIFVSITKIYLKGANMTLKKNFGINVQKYRKLHRLTQEKLAEVVGVDATSISSIETGKYFPSAENLSRIANALNVNVADLFYFENCSSKEQLYSEITGLIELFKDDSLRLNAIKNFLKTLV